VEPSCVGAQVLDSGGDGMPCHCAILLSPTVLKEVLELVGRCPPMGLPLHKFISKLDPWARALAVYASRRGYPHTRNTRFRLLARRYRVGVRTPLGSAERFQALRPYIAILLSRELIGAPSSLCRHSPT